MVRNVHSSPTTELRTHLENLQVDAIFDDTFRMLSNPSLTLKSALDSGARHIEFPGERRSFEVNRRKASEGGILYVLKQVDIEDIRVKRLCKELK
jgi:hypothetical protein